MLKEEVKEYIRRGVDRNIVCYDSDATGGTGDLTKRLLALMRVVGRRNSQPQSRIMKWYISDKVDPDLLSEMRLWVFAAEYELFDDKASKELYEDELKSSYPINKEHLVIGVDGNDLPLLGAF
jgi:hypothetical protein